MALKPADPSYPPDIDPGEMTTRITLLVQTLGSDASGAVATYAAGSPPVSFWGRVKWLRGTDAVKAGQDISQAFAEVTIRYRTDVAAQDRIQLPSGAQLIIQAVRNAREMNAILYLDCIAVGSNDK